MMWEKGKGRGEVDSEAPSLYLIKVEGHLGYLGDEGGVYGEGQKAL